MKILPYPTKYLMLLGLLLFTFLLPAENQVLLAQQQEEVYVPETDQLVLKKLEAWQDLKFGLLMHWGPYSQWGIVESWSICPEDEGWCRRSLEDYYQYLKKYEDLKKTFNPFKFDPAIWARAAKEAGMRYVIFTTKHHDGFCMFDTSYTDYKITDPECPFSANPRANVTREIFEAFRKEGFWVGAYFSKPDWHSPYYWWSNFPPRDRNVNYDPEAYPERWEKFVEYTHNQILELMTGYGRVDILWLDGGWVSKKSKEELQKYYEHRLKESQSGYLKSQVISQDIRMDELVAKCREKQPGLIVVDRAVAGKNQNYLTPENVVPDRALPYPWESCIISGGGWSYTRDAKYMSGRRAIHLLVDIVAKGGNLLLNIAPGPDGTWQQGAFDLLQEYAAWMKINSRAIYGTRPFPPYKEGKVCFTRGKNGSVYIIYLADEGEAMPEKIYVESFKPGPGTLISLLGSSQKISWKQSGRGFEISVPPVLRHNPPCKYAWVFQLTGSGL
ncbi:MAG: alpha-L-fucosidase [Candidatus Saccharicenans sp.]|uniref:alpha-L-fucosidase n=1 Tax=Candidatus Saccharicenans sp. TaxID=2819258 RepID=UPI0040496376